MSAGREVLERLKRKHYYDAFTSERDEGRRKWCHCGGLWPCDAGVTLAALEEALQWLPEGNRRDDVLSKLAEG